MNARSTVVLYAEDSEDDAFLMQRAFNKLNFPGTLVVVPNGLEAQRYLEGANNYADRQLHPLPKIILLDVKMPHLGGLDVLKWLRAQNEFQHVPVFMFSTSSQPADIVTAYQYGANSYLVKPSNLGDFSALVEDLAAVCGRDRTPDNAPPTIIKIRGAITRPV